MTKSLELLITCLTVYLLIGLFGLNFGLETNVIDNIFKYSQDDNSIINTLPIISDITNFGGVIIGIAVLPLTVHTSENIPFYIQLMLDIVAFLTYLSIAYFFRGN